MIKTLSAITIVTLIGCAVPRGAGCSEYLLFTPSPLQVDAIPPEKGSGILVRRITIKPGDTLGGISRKISGKASYFPQILLFNDIKNPDLIFAGRELLVPVKKDSVPEKFTEAEEKAPLPDRERKRPVAKAKPAAVKPAAVKPAAVKPAAVKPAAVKPAKPAAVKPDAAKVRGGDGNQSVRSSFGHAGAGDEQNSYQKAMSLYRQGDYSKALAAFSLFVEKYPQSPSAPDASLYKAECLYKLSGE